MNGLDIHILTSKSEAFPNVVVEAMSCKTHVFQQMLVIVLLLLENWMACAPQIQLD